jgi:hypothetical protein
MAKDDVTNNGRDKSSKPDVTRRNFITKAAIGAGATAATLIGSSNVSASPSDTADAAARPIKIPDEFAQAVNAPNKKADFPMTCCSPLDA